MSIFELVPKDKLQYVRAYKVYAHTDGQSGYLLDMFKGYILVNSLKNHDMFVEHWCYNKYGNKIGFINGVLSQEFMITKWTFTPCSIDEVYPMEHRKMILDKIEDHMIEKIWNKKECALCKRKF